MITLLVDNDSWIVPYVQQLKEALENRGYAVTFARHANDVAFGWACFLLGCTKIVGKEILGRNTHNLVVHESDLPRGRGFAPMAWQILEGKNTIPVCLLEADAKEADAGPVWLRDQIQLSGNELCPEWRRLQGKKTQELCLRFVEEYGRLHPEPQRGEPTWYPRRHPKDSELDASLPLQDQFNLLRIVDNDRYPAFLRLGGQKVILRVEASNGDE